MGKGKGMGRAVRRKGKEMKNRSLEQAFMKENKI